MRLNDDQLRLLNSAYSGMNVYVNTSLRFDTRAPFLLALLNLDVLESFGLVDCVRAVHECSYVEYRITFAGNKLAYFANTLGAVFDET